MKLNYVVDEKNHIEVEFIGEEYSIPEMLKSILIENKNVDFVACVIGHPNRDPPKLVLKTGKGNARILLKKAMDEALKTLEKMKSPFGK